MLSDVSEISQYDEHTSSARGWPVLGSKKAKVLTSNLLTCEWDVVFPCLSTGTELLILSWGFGHLSTCRENSAVHVPVHICIDFFKNLVCYFNILPIIEECPHRVSRARIGKAVSHSQGKCWIWERLHNGNLHIHSFTKGQDQWKLFFRNEGCKRCI